MNETIYVVRWIEILPLINSNTWRGILLPEEVKDRVILKSNLKLLNEKK